MYLPQAFYKTTKIHQPAKKVVSFYLGACYKIRTSYHPGGFCQGNLEPRHTDHQTAYGNQPGGQKEKLMRQ